MACFPNPLPYLWPKDQKFDTLFSCSVLNVPGKFVKEVNNSIFSFIWNFKPDKIKRKTLTGPICNSGLNMLDFDDVVKSLKIAWVNHYCKANDRH